MHKIEDVKNVYRKAQEEGNEGHAREAGQYLERLTAELQEIKQHFNKNRAGNDPGRDESQQREIRQYREQLIGKIHDLEKRVHQAKESGQQEEAKALRGKIEVLVKELHAVDEKLEHQEGDEYGHRDEQHDDREHNERMRHLQTALEHLHAGGFGDLAKMIERDIDEMHRLGDSPRHDQDDRQGPSRDELEHVVRELGQQLEDLGRKLQHVRRTLEESNR
jgi:hypothetical protein